MDKLRQAAWDARIDAIAVTHTRPQTDLQEFLHRAQEEGRYSQFAAPDIKGRTTPTTVLASAKSIITVAVAYKTVDPGPAPKLHGTISRSAWGLDYHQVLRQAMERLVPFLQTEYGVTEWYCGVDDTPLVERALSRQAGLAQIGPNCAAYVHPYGSWVFLGEILIDVELELSSQKPVGPLCTACDERCVKACPTGALMSPGQIDASRCLSFLTQKTGSIPEEFRDRLGSRLWGCDTCQQVCPANRAAEQSRHSQFEPIVGPHFPLTDLLTMTKAQYYQVFGETSIAWRGKNVLQRNACIILGNQKAKEALPLLEEIQKEHPSPAVQEAAQWAIEKITSA